MGENLANSVYITLCIRYYYCCCVDENRRRQVAAQVAKALGEEFDIEIVEG